MPPDTQGKLGIIQLRRNGCQDFEPVRMRPCPALELSPDRLPGRRLIRQCSKDGREQRPQGRIRLHQRSQRALRLSIVCGACISMVQA